MRSKKKIDATFNLTAMDVNAILCALPLVIKIGADTSIQQDINAALCESVAQKLVSHSTNFTANEVRVIYASIAAASLFLSGQAPATFANVEQEHKKDLSKYLFTYNRLNPIFQSFCDQFRS